MRKLFLFLACLLYPVLGFGIGSATGFCEQGNQTVVTQGLTSVTKVQKSYPSCTITVFLPGTVTFATIYSDNAVSPTPLANPFTSNASGSWQFYAANGAYDIVKSGGTPSPGISPAVTTFSVSVFDPSAATGLVLDATSPKYGTGTDICLRINTAIGFLPASTGGTIDARGFQGATSCTSNMWNGVTKPGVLLFPAGTVSATVPQNIPANWILAGSGRNVTIWNQTVNVTNTHGETAGDGFRVTGPGISIYEFDIRGAAGASPPGIGEGANALIWRAGGDNTNVHDMILEQFANRAIQVSSSVGIQVSNVVMQDLGDECVLFYFSDNSTVRNSQCARFRQWALDSNSSGTQFVDNYIHDQTQPGTFGVGDAGGITFSATAGQSLVNELAHGNQITNMYAGVLAMIATAAVDGASVEGVVISNNVVTTTTIQSCTYTEPNSTGVIGDMVITGNYCLNSRIYTKTMSRLSVTGNVATATIGNTDTAIRIDSAGSSISITGNTTSGFDEGLRTACQHCSIVGNTLSGLTTAWNYFTLPDVAGPNVLSPTTDSRVFSLNATTGAMTPTLLTDTQRNAITPQSGAIAGNSTRNELQYYNGATWNASVPATAVTFTNSWVNLGGGSNPPSAQYWRGQNQHVYVVGAIKSGTNNTSAFTLPSGFRPPNDTLYNVTGTDGFNFLPTQVTVQNNGGVVVNVQGASGGVVAAVYFGVIDVVTAYDK